MSLSRIEQETIIIFNEAESTACIQVHNGRIRRRLEQIHAERPEDVSIDHDGDYIIPKSWIKINPSIALTEEQRTRRSEHMKRVRQAQKLN